MTAPQNINLIYKDTKANVEALSGDIYKGFIAYATDTNQLGTYNGSSWVWIVESATTFDSLTDVSNLDSDPSHYLAGDGTFRLVPIVPSEEAIQDLVGLMVTSNTETGISVTYNDTLGKVDFDAQTAGDARYAPIAKGVTNGDLHDHSGGDGAQIAYSSLSGTPTIPTDITPKNGWIARTETWTRTGNHTFTLSSDLTAVYRKNTKVRYKDGGAYEYGVVQSSSLAGDVTTVTLITNTDFAMAATTITDTYVSYIDNPEGFPDWFIYAPTVTGWGASPPSGSIYQWRTSGVDSITVHINQPNNATSTTTTVIFTLPVTAKTLTGAIWVAIPGQCVNNTGVPTTPCYGEIPSGSTVVNFYTDYSGSAWTASGNKRIVTSEITYRY